MSDQNPPAWGDQPSQPSPSSPPPPPPPPPPGPDFGTGHDSGTAYGPGYGSGYGSGYDSGYGAAHPSALAYASWGQRVGGYLVDLLVLLPAYIVVFVGLGIGAGGASTDPVTGEVSGGNAGGFVIASVGYLLMFAILIWNTIIRQGRTGWSIGKQLLGIRLVREEDGAPMGAGMNFVRQIVHVVDGIPCYLGFLWPLWDAKRQTFADKIMKTVVVQQKKS